MYDNTVDYTVPVKHEYNPEKIDTLTSKDAKKKHWEKEFLSQQARWQGQESNAGQKNHNQKNLLPSRKIYYQTGSFYSAKNLSLADKSAASIEATTSNIDKFQGNVLSKRSPYFLSSQQIIMPTVSKVVTSDDRIMSNYTKNAFFESSVLNNKWNVYLNGKNMSANKTNRSEHGGLAIFKDSKLFLWMRSSDKSLPKLIKKSLHFFKINLVRFMFNGELLKNERG